MGESIYTYAADCVHCVAEKAVARTTEPVHPDVEASGMRSAYLLGWCEQALKEIARPRTFTACERHRQATLSLTRKQRETLRRMGEGQPSTFRERSAMRRKGLAHWVESEGGWVLTKFGRQTLEVTCA